jgi:DNA repair photolyase
MKVNEVIVKSALSRSSLPGLVYALNPYRGCSHACTYCYAPSVIHENRQWGEFVDVKLNLPSVLAKEIAFKPKGIVGIGTVTDAYQPAEKEYEITRKCLEVLLKKNWPISIQTKSDLVLRDLDLIEKFKDKDIGFTIATLDDNARRRFEPHSSSIEARLDALRTIAKRGIKTWVFLGPIIPDLLGDTLEELIKTLSGIGIDHLLFDRLNIKPGMNGFDQYRDYDYKPIEANVKELCRHYNIRCYNAF